MFYAQPNAGKTLITLHLIMEAIQSGWLEAQNLYYINMDDSSSGLLEKAYMAQELGFHMLSDGYNSFSLVDFRQSIEKMVASDSAKGMVVVLDTLKKFTNLMSKELASEFSELMRRFSLKGGSVIALAHANKKADAQGNPIYAGTTDILDDFDCGYSIKVISQDAASKVVEFINIKRRGDVVSSASYRYSVERNSYAVLLQSVQEIDPVDLEMMKQEVALTSELPVIQVIQACIEEGINTKIALLKGAASRAGCSRKNAMHVIERYTGTDPALHRWHYEVKARGAQIFALNLLSPGGSALGACEGHSPLMPANALAHQPDIADF